MIFKTVRLMDSLTNYCSTQNRVPALLHDEPGPVVQGLLRGHPLLHPGGSPGPLVLRLRAPDLRRRLLRLPQEGHRAPRQDQPDPQANPRPERLHPGN